MTQRHNALHPVSPFSGSPEIVVIIPTCGHPVLLAEALESVLAQDCTAPVGIVVVSDGCSFADTDLVASAYATAHRHIAYLRRKCGSRGAARNLGIDYALGTWPSVRAIYFLDADHRLAVTALSEAYQALTDDPGVGWIYPSIDSVGADWSVNFAASYSALLHIIYDNICNIGSLVSKQIFEAGVRFDGDASSGYEDWDFWLQCLGKGFVGRPVPHRFGYRHNPESSLRDVPHQRAAMLERLRRRHRSLAAPRNLLQLEHASNPRFLFVPTGQNYCVAFSDPAAGGGKICISEMAERFYSAVQYPDEHLLWPFFVFGSSAAIAGLKDAKLLHGLFHLMQRESLNASFVSLRLDIAAGEIAIDIATTSSAAIAADSPHLLMLRSETVKRCVFDDVEATADGLSLHHAFGQGVAIDVSLPDDVYRRHVLDAESNATDAFLAMARALTGSPLKAQSAHHRRWRRRYFPDRGTYHDHLCKYLGVAVLMPRLESAGLEVGIVAPVASSGEVTPVAYAMAQYLRRQGAGVHLFVSGGLHVTMMRGHHDAFDTINILVRPDYAESSRASTANQRRFVPSVGGEADASDIGGFLSNLDVVVNCHSVLPTVVIGSLRAGHTVKTVAYVHEGDFTTGKRPTVDPYLAVAFEQAYDVFLAGSRQQATELHALGVSQDKILAIQHASSFEVSSEIKQNQRMVRAAPRGARRLRILYINRLDPQQGRERLLGVCRQIICDHVEVDIRVIASGSKPGSSELEEFLHTLGIAVEKPIDDTVTLSDAYCWADVLLLPSQWECAQRVVLECQEFGCIPLATKVGAIDEVLSDGCDGMLVDEDDDQAVVNALVSRVKMLITDDALRVRLALTGLRRSDSNAWRGGFASLGQWLRQAFPGRSQ